MAGDKVLTGDQAPEEKEIVEDVVITDEPIVEEPKLLAGKFNNEADLEKGYTELVTKLGDQGNKLGESEKERSILLTQMEQLQKAPAPKEDTPTDFDTQLQDITKKVEEGELSISEGMLQTAQVTSQMATTNAVSGVKQAQEQQVVEDARQTFSADNPDFFEMQQSGALDEVKGQYAGLHDDFSAYYHKKAMDTEANSAAAVEAAKAEGFEAGKAEMAKIAEGSNDTKKVLQAPGGEAQKIGRTTGPLKGNEMRDSGLAALKKARSG